MQALAEHLPAIAQQQIGQGGFLILRPDSGGSRPTSAYIKHLLASAAWLRGEHSMPFDSDKGPCNDEARSDLQSVWSALICRSIQSCAACEMCISSMQGVHQKPA